jgi:hypothetical protein
MLTSTNIKGIKNGKIIKNIVIQINIICNIFLEGISEKEV